MKFIFYFLLLIPCTVFSQQRYIIFLADKGVDVVDYYKEPAKLIGQTVFDKRTKSGISTDYYDMPVAAVYKELFLKNNISVIRSSKWLNALLIETNRNVAEITSLSDKIKKIIPVGNAGSLVESKFSSDFTNNTAAKGTSFDYGLATTQNNLTGIKCLHDRGFTGRGITVAFLDVGFPGIDTIGYFDSLRTNNRVKGTYDFWDGTTNVYHKAEHGTNCASIILANKSGSFVGTAPDANAIFAITDHYITETPQDEFNFVAALEWADSLGADVISASVSYKDFDDTLNNYSYSDMDGQTAITTLGCRIAAAKGLLIVNAAGNSGRICAPCDADSIICVGGAGAFKQYDLTSSRGPSYDGRVKPDVAARTLGVYVVNEFGTLSFYPYGGTSSATPQVAGLAICLKQSHPTASVIQIVRAIQQSANHYNTPDSLTGYGVPDACKADSILSRALGAGTISISQESLRIYPNPSSDILYFQGTQTIHEVHIISLAGQLVKQQSIDNKGGAVMVDELAPGTYLLQAIYKDGRSETRKFIRK